MKRQVLIAGGGIGGLGMALACARAGVQVDVLEQSPAFTEVGAGIQLGPNAVRVLADWGLIDALHEVAAFPDELRVRDAHDGETLGQLRLAERARTIYGQPYATIHRADAIQMLLHAVQAEEGVQLHLNERMRTLEDTGDGVMALTESGAMFEAPALIGCDGLWSLVRKHLLGSVAPRFSGHLAYRGMVAQADLPEALRTQSVTAWLGPRLHVVHYPVRSGTLVNVVAVVHGRQTGNPHSWSHEANRAELLQALGPVHPGLMGMLDAVNNWKLWPLNDRPPMTGPYEHAVGRMALAGDAAHPMRPYLAQGAAMALEDAWTMGRLLAGRPVETDCANPDTSGGWPQLFQRFGQVRWKRNAWVQMRSARNGTVFHADGALRSARNLSMGLLRERLLDNPRLYSGPPAP